jgi:NitT/TauT family transport system ATP-binding protein
VKTRPTGPAKIIVERLTKTFLLAGGTVEALRAVDLEVREGEFCCLVGPSGCGKTTLLRLIAGLERPTSGEVHIRSPDRDGRPLNAMVFQEQSVFPWMTVEDNVAYGLRMGRAARDRVRREVDRHLRMVGLAGFGGAYPHQLSGGMKQRVSLARALAVDPEVLLMDEPFAALDEQTKILLQDQLMRIWDETRKTVVFITHSIDEAIALGDRVVVMTARPGRVKLSIEVDLPRPRTVYELKSSPAFADLVSRVWSALKDEVLDAYREQIQMGTTA